jgi:hypothetical protein
VGLQTVSSLDEDIQNSDKQRNRSFMAGSIPVVRGRSTLLLLAPVAKVTERDTLVLRGFHEIEQHIEGIGT